MLNEKRERELAYVVKVDDVVPIAGKDRVECAIVGGWTLMVPKGDFVPGSVGVYFEIDSKTPETEPFYFLAKRKFKVKTQKFKTPEGPFYSQGLLMKAEDLGFQTLSDSIKDSNGDIHFADGESRFLTKLLDVTYADAADNERKAGSKDKYKLMAQRNVKLFKKKPFRWLMRREWGRKLLFFFFGKKKDKRNGWPAWVKKTDEERVENMPAVLKDKSPFVVTEKLDGTSTTFTMKRGKFGRNDLLVCSRNVVFDKPDKHCYYDTNVYLEMAAKYDIENVLTEILKANPQYEWVTIQGETFGSKIQKRNYGLAGHDFMAFNFVTSTEGRWGSVEAAEFMKQYNVPWVPILDENFTLPDTIEELREYVHSTGSCVDGAMKEGVVIRSKDGVKSFKCVDPEFLAKYHND